MIGSSKLRLGPTEPDQTSNTIIPYDGMAAVNKKCVNVSEKNEALITSTLMYSLVLVV